MSLINSILGDNFFIKILLIPSILGFDFLVKNTIQRQRSHLNKDTKLEWFIFTILFTTCGLTLKILFVKLDILSPTTHTYLLNDGALYFTSLFIYYMTSEYYRYKEYSVLLLLLIYYFVYIHIWGLNFRSSFLIILSLLLFWYLTCIIIRKRAIIMEKYYLYFSLSIGVTVIVEIICLSEFSFSYIYLVAVFMKSIFLLVLSKIVIKLLEIVTEEFSKLKKHSYIDMLTGVSNIRKFYEDLELILDGKEFIPFSLALFDIDSFKSINDNYGHSIGDDVLNKICRIIENILSEDNIQAQLFRYGGDEFYILFRKKTNKNIIELLEQIRLEVVDYNFKYKEIEFKVSISIGVYEISEKIKFRDILTKVDEKLYCAKVNGKNKICY